MILSVTLNPSVDRTLIVETLKVADTNRVLNTETDAGGKGINVARVVGELGIDVLATGFLAGKPGLYVKHVLDQEGVPHSFVEVPGETRLNVLVESADGPPTTFNERGPEISNESWTQLLDTICSRIDSFTYVAMGGSIPPGLGPEAFSEIVSAVDRPCVVDADGAAMRIALDCKPFMVKPNRQEAERLLNVTIGDVGRALRAARELRDRGVTIAIVSLGKDGAVMSSGQGDFVAEPPRVEAVSTVGAGDSLIGGFMYGLEKCMSYEDCLRWGIAAGAATATTDASEICKRPKVEELLPGVIIREP
ncbi:MAG: 1-phosphofructokinase [Armatimonadetes bacterium]|nr:1-phosphofructokinase [Armatimonadota bacterium]